jgi:hypothetical protein
MASDLYGIDYRDPAANGRRCSGGRLDSRCPLWMAGWRNRSSAEWRDLSAKYAFRLVAAPSGVALDLTPEVVGRDWTLYSIR